MSDKPSASESIPVRRPLDLRAYALMLMLCMVWGFQQVAMKSVADEIAPTMQLAVRFAIASVFFAALVFAREGRRAFADGTVPSGIVLGLVFALEFVFVGQSLKYTTAAHAVVFLYSAPVFTALGVRFLPEERLGATQWCGIGVAFAGIALAFLGGGDRSNGGLLFGDFLALCGAVAWGFGNVTLRRGKVGTADAAKTVLYQIGMATLVLAAMALLTHQSRMVLTPLSIYSMLFQTLVISIGSYLTWFWLLRHYLTTRLMLLSFLTPLFGVMFGAVLLGDSIEPHFATGALLVLAGILVVNAPRSLWRRSGS